MRERAVHISACRSSQGRQDLRSGIQLRQAHHHCRCDRECSETGTSVTSARRQHLHHHRLQLFDTSPTVFATSLSLIRGYRSTLRICASLMPKAAPQRNIPQRNRPARVRAVYRLQQGIADKRCNRPYDRETGYTRGGGAYVQHHV